MGDVGQAAVVTGGAAGIGRTIVAHLASRGMAVVAADRDPVACAEARKQMAPFGSRVCILEGDIATEAGAATAIRAALDRFGRLDLLCNNAAIQRLGPIEDMALDTWREAFRVNVEGVLLCSKLAVPIMKRQGSGSIVNISSISGLVPYATGGAYAASKAAVIMLTKVLALEVGPYGIRVNCICPGAIRHRPSAGAEEPAMPSHIPIGRFGKPEDVAHLVHYLASEEASYLTGATLVLDGGATAGRPRRR